MKRMAFPFLLLCFGLVLVFTSCTNSKNYETRSQCMDRCIREQYVCALALAPQLDNATSATMTCVSLYVICYDKCPAVSTSRSTTSSRSSSTSRSGSGNKGGSSSNTSSGSGSGSGSSGGGN